MRISVSGTRGKTTTVNMLHDLLTERGLKVVSKTTGEEAVVRVSNERFKINRPRSVLDENLEVIKIPHDVAIIENQAITPYTMRVFHRIVKPSIVIVTNVRMDHTEFLGEDRREIAKSFISSLNEHVKVVMSGESSGELEEVMRDGLRKFRTEYVRARSYGVPGSESVGIAEEVLRLVTGERLREEEKIRLLSMIESMMSIRRSGELLWYNGAKVNDPDSAEILIDHLLKKYRRGMVISANFRSDRKDRTSLFADFLKRWSKEDLIRSIFVSGYAAKSVANYVGEKCVPLKEDLSSARSVIELAVKEGAILTLLANRKTKFVDLMLEEIGRLPSLDHRS
ncbi:MAG: Mur ligase family protein [Candidatus Korarchaeum sp.]